MRFDAFLSYSQMDRKFATRFQALLEAAFLSYRKLRLFRDQDDLGATPDLTGTLRGALEDSDRLILLCTANSVARPKWLELEIRHFWEHTSAPILIMALSDQRVGPFQTWCFGESTQTLDALPEDCRTLLPAAAREILSQIGAAPASREVKVVFGSKRNPLRAAALAHRHLSQGSRSSFVARYLLMTLGLWTRRTALVLVGIILPGFFALIVLAMGDDDGGEYWDEFLELQGIWMANMDISLPAAYGGPRLEAELRNMWVALPDGKLRYYSTVDGDTPPPSVSKFIAGIEACHITHADQACSGRTCSAARRLSREASAQPGTSDFLTCVRSLGY